MAITINGTTGISGVDGSAATPALQGADTNTGISFGTDTVTINTGGVARVMTDASGNVGIGTTSPVFRLDLGTGSSADSSQAVFTRGLSDQNFQLRVVNGASGTASGTAQARFGLAYQGTTVDAATLVFMRGSSTTDGSLAFFTNTLERMRIDSSGNLLVGTTTAASGNSNTFQVAGTSAADVAVFARSTTNSANVRCVIASAPNYAGDTGFFFIGARSTGDRFYVQTSGNVANSNNSYGGISDAKLKENIVDATPKLDKLQQVRVVNYNLIGETQKQLGVIAQELEQIFPGMVEETPDRDADGNDVGTTTKTVKYSVFVPMLIKAIQELKAELDSVKAELATLKGAA